MCIIMFELVSLGFKIDYEVSLCFDSQVPNFVMFIMNYIHLVILNVF
jgi:hypothetical protein